MLIKNSYGRLCVLILLLLSFNLSTKATTGCSPLDFRVAQTLDATLPSQFPPPSYAVDDLNGDGKADIVLTDGSASRVVVLLNDGTGHFVAAKKFGVNGGPRSVAIGEFNGDNNRDLVVANFTDNTVSVLLGTGGGNFSAATNIGVSTGPLTVHVADVSGDGKADILVGHSASNTGTITVLLGNGAGSFSQAPGSPISMPGQNSSVAAITSADFNNDGKRDLAVAASFAGFLLFLGNGTGGFAAPTQIFNLNGLGIVTSDFNNDGKADLGLGSTTLNVLLGNGDGTFQGAQSASHVSGAIVGSLAVGDIDGNGSVDIAATLASGQGVTYFTGNGTAAFTGTPGYNTTRGDSNIALGDFDSDGDPDIVAGDSVMLNTAGKFEAAGAAFSVSDVIQTNTSATPFDVAIGDLNGDGRSDMAVLHRPLFGPDGPGSRVSVLLSDAQGNFTRISSIVFSNGSMRRVLIGDFNKDGKGDLAVSWQRSFPTVQNEITIALGNGNGTFALPTNIDVNIGDIAVADINNDTNPDIVGNAGVLLGQGNGSFTFSGGAVLNATLPRITLADFDGDSKLDLAVTDFFGKQVTVVFGTGTDTFIHPLVIPTVGSPLAITSGDFNGDGKADFAVASQSPTNNQLSLLEVASGNGTGGFATPFQIDLNGTTGAISSTDFDGDGKVDIAVKQGNMVSVFSGNATGDLTSSISFDVGAVGDDIGIGDFNSDGRKDLAVPLSNTRNVGVLFGKPASTQPCLFADDLTITEGDSNSIANVTVRLSEATASVVRVNYTLRNGSADEGNDFELTTGSVTFQPGETSRNVPINIFGDTINEDTESFTLTLSGAVNARISKATARITINDNDGLPSLSINDASVTEGDFQSDTTIATFTVSLSAPSAKAVPMNWNVVGGTATVNEDFGGSNGVLVIPAGATSRTITVPIIGDRIFEPDETFFVNLSNVSQATVLDGTGQGTIVNNDPIPTVSVSGGNATEANGVDSTATFTVTLSNPSTQTITVNYATADGTATAGSDYVATSGTVTFNPLEIQKTFTVTVKDDLIDETSETFLVNLSTPVNATILTGQGTGNIFDNDGPTISINDVTVTEGDSGIVNATFTLTLSAASPEVIQVRTSTSNGTATANVDYTSVTNQNRTFAPGTTSLTFNVAVRPDYTIESEETFFVNLFQAFNATIADSQGIGTIQDNDTTSVQFSADTASVNESAGSITVTVQHVGDIQQPFNARYFTSSSDASDRSDFTAAYGTLQFAAGETSKTITIFITNDALVEGPEIFSVGLVGPSGARVNDPSSVLVTINSDDVTAGPNPIDNSDFFVRQHYRDFLNREADASGLAFWTNEIESCGADAQCRELKRINVSAAFFLSIEFKETGYLAYRTYKAAFGDAVSPNVPGTVPQIDVISFLTDSKRIGQGVQVGIGNWQEQLENNKVAYMQEFVQRFAFLNAYPNAMTADQFVDQLNQRAGNVLSSEERAQLIAMLGATPADITKRAAVLRKVAEDSDLDQHEFNRAFVLMQYFGYLRRSPSDQPDFNFSGWKFWLDKLNQFNGDFIQAEMVKAFLTSLEYRGRFGN